MHPLYNKRGAPTGNVEVIILVSKHERCLRMTLKGLNIIPVKPPNHFQKDNWKDASFPS